MKNAFLLVAAVTCCCLAPTAAQVPVTRGSHQTSAERIDSAAIEQIMGEATKHSQVMEILSYLTDIHGPRLTGSPQYMKAAQWVRGKFTAWGLANPHLEGWWPFGRGWELERYWANVVAPVKFPLLSYPKAWSPGTKGEIDGELIHVEAGTDSALETYRGKLKGKFVVSGGEREIKANFEPLAKRETEASLLELANADVPRTPRRFRDDSQSNERSTRALEHKRQLLFIEEGALALLTGASRDGGNLMVMDATVPRHPDSTGNGLRSAARSAKPPRILPQVVVAAEQFNRLVRMLKKGEKVRLEMNLEAAFSKEDSGYNVVAEIPGTDLEDEVVMVGAHLDSWHGGTGATDNATGSAVCMEAMRVLKTLGLKPRRTIRIGLWGGEEQGLLGSRAYVKRHFADPTDTSTGPRKRLTPAGEKFSIYFNDDNGTGKIRGIYMQGNETARPIFRKWFSAVGDPSAATLTTSSTGSTDHVSFDQAGLPGFQFIQDPIEYGTRTWHSTLDVYDRAQEDDLKQSAAIMAVFAYQAAMRDEGFPRKP